MSLCKRIENAIKSDTPFFSLEFFPPRSGDGFQKLTARITRLAKLEPMFINITWRSFEDRRRTLELCDWVQNKVGIEVMMHISCAGLTKAKATRLLDAVKRSGVRNLLVLRGEAPLQKNTPDNEVASQVSKSDNASESDFPYAKDLVSFIRASYGGFFGIAVAGFLEGTHNPTPSMSGSTQSSDAAQQQKALYFKHLKEKVLAGADLIITQLFFDVSKYEVFVKDCADHGITVPILAGMMAPPTITFLRRVTQHYGVSLPGTMTTKLRMVAHRPMDYNHYITQCVVNQARTLRKMHVPGLHFFTINVESLVHAVLTKLGFQETVASRRRLPWRSTGRRNEDVRPIFWSNRQQSYLARTSSWVSLPTGRWSINGALSLEPGDRAPTSNDEADDATHCADRGNHSSSSNEYVTAGAGGDAHEKDSSGDGSQHLSLGWSETERRIYWGNALAYVEDIADTFVKYLRGQIPCLPWCEEELNAETVTIRSDLIKINQLGFWTINSQPRVCGVPSTDPTFGWGTPGGYVYQKAYVECFCSAQNLQLLMKAVEDDRHGSMTYIASDVRGNMYTNSKFRGPNAVTWGVFMNDEVLQPTVVDHEAFMVWKDEAFSLWLKNWAVIYEPDSRASALIHSVHDSYFLVSVVDNDFMHGNIYSIFDAIEELRAPQVAAAAAYSAQTRFLYNTLSSAPEGGLDAEARFRAMSSRQSGMSGVAPGGGGALELSGRGRGASAGFGGGRGRSSGGSAGFATDRSRSGRGARHASGRYGLTSAYSAPEIGGGGGGNVFERSGGFSGRLDSIHAQRYNLPRGPDTRAPRTLTSLSGRGFRS